MEFLRNRWWRIKENSRIENNYSTPPFETLEAMSYIIKRCHEKDIPINITKIQKLMYCCYGTVYAAYKIKLIDEFPCAWRYGPVFPTALRSASFLGLEVFSKKETPNISHAESYILNLIDSTLENFGIYSAFDLTRWSHQANSPWSKASWNGYFLYGRLDDNIIKSFFKKYLTR